MALSTPAQTAQPPATKALRDANVGASEAYWLLHLGFVALPIVVGADKFLGYLTNWDKYLAPIIPSTLHQAAHPLMMVVGTIEIIVGLIVAFVPRFGAYVVAVWLLASIGNLCLNPNHYWDVVAADFGLILAALALGGLSGWKHRMKVEAPETL